MTTHEFVYQTFVIYIFVKALVLAPLLWLTVLHHLNERKSRKAQVPSPAYESSMALSEASAEIA
jgi:hypothetical protein